MEGEEESVDRAAGKPQKGKFWLAVVLAVLIGAGMAGYFVFGRRSSEGKSNSDIAVKSNGGNTSAGRGAGNGGGKKSSADVRWEMAADGDYQSSGGTAPACPSPLVLDPPADLSKVVSILYPGQIRGGNYKPHGGFRFADSANSVTVTAPMEASVVDGSRYLVDGEVQYLFDFVNPCGIKYRLGHLRTLSSTFAALADRLPAAQNMDSRTTQINPPVKVAAGDTIATAVGLLGAGNAFFDFGVFDLRQPNEASKNAAFQAAHADDRDLAWHGACWFDLLSAENKAKVKGLPPTAPGAESDYCK